MVLLAILLLGTLFVVYSGVVSLFGHMCGMMGMMGYAQWPVLLIGVAFLALYLITGLMSKSASELRHKESLKVLEERYARGEITREQYLRMREDLKQ
jgi:putative membrane protein